jgi:hypothetical protein
MNKQKYSVIFVLQQFRAMGMKRYQYPIEWLKLVFNKKYKEEWLYEEWVTPSYRTPERRVSK